MKNPPDFIMYVVMYKPDPNNARFVPYWDNGMNGITRATGYMRKKDARFHLKLIRETWGKENAYVQQYGPYS